MSEIQETNASYPPTATHNGSASFAAPGHDGKSDIPAAFGASPGIGGHPGVEGIGHPTPASATHTHPTTATGPTENYAAPSHGIPSAVGAGAGIGGVPSEGIGHTSAVNSSANSTHTGSHDPYAEQAKKEATIGKVEIAIGKVLHSSGLVAKGEAHIEHASVVAAHGAGSGTGTATPAGSQAEREALSETPALAGGAESLAPGVADPVVAGPGGQSGPTGAMQLDHRMQKI